jgi:hypothetical protein
MAICELDSDDSLCKNAKMTIIRVHLESVDGLEEHAEYDLVVPTEVAKETLGESWEPFLKRNRIDGEQELIYLEKVKKEADRELLMPHSRRLYTGWFVMEELPSGIRERIESRIGEEDVVTEWDMLSFDEMNETCASCPMSWDKGRGCIGTFGPGNSLLPGIAEKHSCEIVASVPLAAEDGKRFTPEEAERLIEEVTLLREKLPDEGKMMVRRYGGVLDRLEKMAETCRDHGARFYFM